jgi:hypothetical protein
MKTERRVADGDRDALLMKTERRVADEDRETLY